MKLRPKITIADHFSELEDPRIERTKRHKLIDIITITICAVICGADGWNDIELYGKCKYRWLKNRLLIKVKTNLPFIWLVPGRQTMASVLGQKKVDSKTNEITAIPELLKVLSLRGCIVTIDAIGCQKKIIKQIISQDGDARNCLEEKPKWSL